MVLVLRKKTKDVCVLGRTNYGGLRNARPPLIDPHSHVVCGKDGKYGESNKQIWERAASGIHKYILSYRF